MNRVEKILSSVRYTLGDRDGSRWPDTRLIQLLDEGQKDLVRQAKLLRTSSLIHPLDYSDFSVYKLPSNFMTLTRAISNGTKLQILSQDNLDEVSDTWETDQSSKSPTALIYDRLNQGLIRLYPTPVADQVTNYNFENTGYLEDIVYEMDDMGVITEAEVPDVITDSLGIDAEVDILFYAFNGTCPGLAIDDEFVPLDSEGNLTDYGFVGAIAEYAKDVIVRSSDYGMIAEIDDHTVQGYGVLTNVRDDDAESIVIDSDYGITTGMSDQENPPEVTIYYIRKPAEISYEGSELEVDETWDQALKHYVTGMALRDDIDAQNRQMGTEELQLYAKDLQLAMKQSSENFAMKTYVTSSYNRGVF